MIIVRLNSLVALETENDVIHKLKIAGLFNFSYVDCNLYLKYTYA